MRKILLLSCVWTAAACAQTFSVGVLGGAPFDDVVKSTNTGGIQTLAKSTNFTIGPSLRIGLPANLRFEVDALYRPYSFSLSGLGFTAPDVSANQWRFPVLLQYRFQTPVLKPFVEGGLSFDHLSGLSTAAQNITSGPGSLLHTTATGVVLGAGVDLKIPFIRLSGELRYTRDTVSAFRDVTNLNQAEVLFGVHF